VLPLSKTTHPELYMMKKFILCLLALGSAFTVFSQSGLHSFATYKGKDYLTFGVGPNYMFSDVGGAKFKNLWVTEWDVLYTRPSVFLGYQHDYNDYVGTRLSVMYSLYGGNDVSSRNAVREFNYNCTAWQASLQTQIYFLRLKFKRTTYDIYGYFGIAGVYYSTYWKHTDLLTGEVTPGRIYADTWPGKELYTSGVQSDMDAFNEKYYNKSKKMYEYSAPTLAFPFGIGFRFPVTYSLYLGAEFGWTYPVGKNADFFDGFNTKWSHMNDSYANLSFVLTYRFAGDDDCYAKYGKNQFKFRR